MAVLEKTEWKKARKLWKEVFVKITEQFLDYYECYVADHNLILAEREEGEIVSMVQLNPYKVRMGTQKADSYYIVAVATREDCRHQGRMRRILTEALQYMDRRKFHYLSDASFGVNLSAL